MASSTLTTDLFLVQLIFLLVCVWKLSYLYIIYILWRKPKPGCWCYGCQFDCWFLWTLVSPDWVLLHPWCPPAPVYPLDQRLDFTKCNSQELSAENSHSVESDSSPQELFLMSLLIPYLASLSSLQSAPHSVCDVCASVCCGCSPSVPVHPRPPPSALWGFLCFFIWPFGQHRSWNRVTVA